MNAEIRVLVTGVGGGGLGEQLIKALRLAEKTRYVIVGTDTSAVSKGLGDCDYGAIVPLAADAGYIPALLDLCKKFSIRVLLPGSEPELKVIGQNRGIFAEAGIFLPINSQEVLDTCFDKSKTVQFLENNGFRFPVTVQVKEERDLQLISFFPAVLKPSVGGSGSANIMVAQNQQELLVFGKYLLNSYPEFIVQEYIGTPDQEYTAGVLCSLEGEIINSIVLRRFISSGLGNKLKIKNRTGRPELGDQLVISSGISQGEFGAFEPVRAACERIAGALDARSAINIQCRLYHDQVYVFEINPRFSGTTSLRAMMGYNEPDILVRKYLFNEQIENHFTYRHGIVLRGLQETVLADKPYRASPQ